MDDNSSLTSIIGDPAFAAEYHIKQALNNFYKLNLQKSAAACYPHYVFCNLDVIR